MGLLVSDADKSEMNNWIELVEKYNETELGQRSPMQVKEVKEDNDGNTVLVLAPKPNNAP